MKRFSFDREVVAFGEGRGSIVGDDGKNVEVDVLSFSAEVYAVRDNFICKVIAACHDAFSANAIVSAMNALAGGE